MEETDPLWQAVWGCRKMKKKYHDGTDENKQAFVSALFISSDDDVR